jgi:hypothetical protein
MGIKGQQTRLATLSKTKKNEPNIIINIGLSVQTTIDSREHPGLLNKIGYIGFPGHV